MAKRVFISCCVCMRVVCIFLLVLGWIYFAVLWIVWFRSLLLLLEPYVFPYNVFFILPGSKVPGLADHVEGDALHKVTLKLRTNGGICKVIFCCWRVIASWFVWIWFSTAIILSNWSLIILRLRLCREWLRRLCLISSRRLASQSNSFFIFIIFFLVVDLFPLYCCCHCCCCWSFLLSRLLSILLLLMLSLWLQLLLLLL